MDNTNLGQYFTEEAILQSIIASLCKNNGRFLEPSAGAGHLIKAVEHLPKKDLVAIEFDSTIPYIVADSPLYMDFFDFSTTEKFDTIFGNPPFVKFRNISKKVLPKLNNDTNLSSCNLFYYFIEKSYYHLNPGGEIVFVIPREFLNSVRASRLRKLLFDNGTITDLYDFGETKLFKKVAPAVIVFRYEKDNHTHITNYHNSTILSEQLISGNFIYCDANYKKYTSLSKYFNIKVGLVTGCNKIFERSSKFSIPTICSDYNKTHKKKDIIFLDEVSLKDVENSDPELLEYMYKHKKVLKNRKIKQFDDTNWYCYGAVRNLDLMRKTGKAIYVNSKTRDDKPFFVDDINYFDGSMLCLFPKEELDLDKWCDLLNNSKKEFKLQNMYVNNKYIFTVSSLSNFKIYKFDDQLFT